MAGEFVHLHLHTDYSLLDGAAPITWSSIKDKEVRKTKVSLVDMAKANHSPAVAMTDHGVMGGGVVFYEEMTAAGIKPIIGCEVYVAEGSRLDKEERKYYHLILLAKDETGYVNLCKIVSDAQLKGFYYKPRTDREFLAAHSEGLIAMSACIQGEVPRTLLDHGEEAAKAMIGRYQDIFGKENFFLEVQYHGIEEQKTVNKAFVKFGKELNIPLVATNDVHYLKKEHASAQDVLVCISTRSLLSDTDRLSMMDHQEFYYKSAEEMEAIFGSEIPEAVPNTLMVAERCNFKFRLDKEAVNHYPVYQVPEGTTQADVLRKLCLDNVERRYGFRLEQHDPKYDEQAAVLQKRLDYELSVIIKTKYPSYFLVVWDFIHAAKSKGIPVGLGRGSGAGSLVAYLTGITNIDPIRYNLLFERFLNPERVSPPDFDIDFCERRREEVIEYVRNKYGRDAVAQIATYGALKAKNAIKDCARVLGRTPKEGDMMTKQVPNDLSISLAKAYSTTQQFKDIVEQNDWAKQVYDQALLVEGLTRNTGIHACGVIICNQPLDEVVPLQRSPEGDPVVQFIAHPCEQLGLLKMDFLGLRTLTVIQDTLDNIRQNRGIDVDMDHIPLDDKKSYDLLNRGDTVAVFQLESGGMQALCRQFVVETIEHIIALIAIYRPGPMEFIPTFVACKKGEQEIVYDHPKMEPILKETYGIMLYQEQIMQVVQVLAGFTLGHADIVRRAIGKKKIDIMEKEKVNFINGCKETNNIDQATSERIWEKINKFAGYGFNKSHSAAYGMVSYRTAYLKANYPHEFMAAVLTSELGNGDKVAFLINACKDMGIRVLPPDVNTSGVNFTVDGDAIRFGLGAIKGLGSVAAESIIAERKKDGKFKDMTDLLERCGSSVNSKALDGLIRSGAFDFMGKKRSQLLATVEETVRMAAGNRQDRESGQASLFDMFGSGDAEAYTTIQYPDIPEIDKSELLGDEKRLLGFYVSGHPAEKYSDIIDGYSTADSLKIQELEPEKGVRIGGLLKGVQRKTSKNTGKQFAVFQIEDLKGSVECMAYGKSYDDNMALYAEDTPVFVEAFTRKKDETSPVTLSISRIMPLEEVMKKNTDAVHLHIYELESSKEQLEELKTLLKKHHGKVPVVLCVSTAVGTSVFIEVSPKYYVSPSPELLAEIRALLGEHRFKIKGREAPTPRPRYYGGSQEEPTVIHTVN